VGRNADDPRALACPTEAALDERLGSGLPFHAPPMSRVCSP
jgi:hypothetical protein